MAANKRDVIFSLTSNDQIVIRPSGTITMQEMHCCHVAKIFLTQGNSEYVLSSFNLPFYHEPLDIFNNLIFKAIAGELTLPESFTKDIGYIDNEYEIKQYCNTYPMSIKADDALYSYTYQLFRTTSRNTWLYNDKDGSIILEITPNYPWSAYKRRSSGLISFKKFLKNYRPFYKVKIPIDLAYQWLRQILNLKQTIKENAIKIKGLKKTQSKDQDTNTLESEYDFPSMILFDMFGCMRQGLSEKHKGIFIKAGFSHYAYWWENLTNAERENLINYDAEKAPRIYEEMP